MYVPCTPSTLHYILVASEQDLCRQVGRGSWHPGCEVCCYMALHPEPQGWLAGAGLSRAGQGSISWLRTIASCNTSMYKLSMPTGILRGCVALDVLPELAALAGEWQCSEASSRRPIKTSRDYLGHAMYIPDVPFRACSSYSP